jgi:hypothetical protein
VTPAGKGAKSLLRVQPLSLLRSGYLGYFGSFRLSLTQTTTTFKENEMIIFFIKYS